MSDSQQLVIVDDDAEMCTVLKDYFSSAGFKVRCFHSADSTLEFWQQQKPGWQGGAVIADLVMPKMNGLEFAKHMRQLGVKAPLILITAYASMTSAVEALRTGVFDYLAKPFELQELAQVVNRALHHSRSLFAGTGLSGTPPQALPTIEALERNYIEFVLEKTGGRKEKAAQVLGINRRTLYRKERAYGLVAEEDEEQ